MRFAVLRTPFRHVQQGSDEQGLGQELGPGKEAGQIGGTGGAGDDGPIGVVDSFQKETHKGGGTACQTLQSTKLL